MKRKILVLLITSLVLNLQAQKEAAKWYFGRYAGLDFMNTQTLTSSNGSGSIEGVPTSVTGPIYTNEGCFSICDSNGNLLLASDGMTVYNKNLQIMPNGTGLLGDPSSVNSGIVIPKPGNNNIFYIITLPSAEGFLSGMRYSIVDMTLDGGLGDIIASSKNTLLSYGASGLTISDTFENSTVVGHNNGMDYWLVTLMRNKFLAWRVTKDGFSAPIISPGPTYGTGKQSSLKLSPDGKKIAFADHSTIGGYLSLGDFDTETGQVTNVTTRTVGVERLYGIEFSPSGQYLYVTALNVADSQKGLYVTHINNINTTPYRRLAAYVGNVQLGMDRRIYAISPTREFAHYPTNIYDRSLWIILDPDDGGQQVTRFDNFFITGTVPTFGLPPFITSFFTLKALEGKEFVCTGNNTEYAIEIPIIGSGFQQIISLEWDFGDGSPTETDTSLSTTKTRYTMNHIFETDGIYNVSVTPYLSSGYPDNIQKKTIEVTVANCKIITNPMIRHNVSPQ